MKHDNHKGIIMLLFKGYIGFLLCTCWLLSNIDDIAPQATARDILWWPEFSETCNMSLPIIKEIKII